MTNQRGFCFVKINDDGDAIVKTDFSKLKVEFDYDIDVIDQSVKFFVNVKEIHILINEDCEIFIELSNFDKHFLKALALVIIEHMEQQ